MCAVLRIFHATEKDVETVKALAAESRLQGYVVRLRGLPYTATQAEILAFMEPVELPQGLDSIHMTYNQDGRPTGEVSGQEFNKLAVDQQLGVVVVVEWQPRA